MSTLHYASLCILLTSCKMYLAVCAKFYSARLLSSVSPFCSRLDGTQAKMLWNGRTTFCPLKYTVVVGNRNLGSYSKSYSNVDAKEPCGQPLHVPRYQLRRCQSAAVRNHKLQHRRAIWPGKDQTQSMCTLTACRIPHFLLQIHSDAFTFNFCSQGILLATPRYLQTFNINMCKIHVRKNHYVYGKRFPKPSHVPYIQRVYAVHTRQSCRHLEVTHLISLAT